MRFRRWFGDHIIISIGHSWQNFHNNMSFTLKRWPCNERSIVLGKFIMPARLTLHFAINYCLNQFFVFPSILIVTAFANSFMFQIVVFVFFYVYMYYNSDSFNKLVLPTLHYVKRTKQNRAEQNRTQHNRIEETKTEKFKFSQKKSSHSISRTVSKSRFWFELYFFVIKKSSVYARKSLCS